MFVVTEPEGNCVVVQDFNLKKQGQQSLKVVNRHRNLFWEVFLLRAQAASLWGNNLVSDPE